MKKTLPVLLLLFGVTYTSNSQNVGIGTTTPLARLHVADSAVLFSGTILSPPSSTTINPPVQGKGTRAFWYPAMGSFRSGYAIGAEWDRDSIGQISFAAGAGVKAKGAQSIAFGYATNAIGHYSTSIGYNTYANGLIATSLGVQTIANGYASTSMGQSTYAYGVGATSSGGSTYAIGNYSFAANEQTLAKARGSFSVGLWNDDSDSPNPDTPSLTDRIFQIGNGTIDQRSNALTVLKNGNIGIGITNPFYKLDMKGRILVRGDGNSANMPGIVFTNIAGDTYKGLVGMHSDSVMGFLASGVNGAFWGLTLNVNSGNVGINTSAPTTGLHVKNKGVLFEGTNFDFSARPPMEGEGTRFMWFPERAAFVAGYLTSFNQRYWDRDSIGLSSFSFGVDTKAKSENAVAIGAGCEAIEYSSVAIGYGAKALGAESVGLGSQSVAIGNRSIAMGNRSIASNYSAVSMGMLSIASGFSSTSMGLESIAKAYGSIAIGMYNDNSDAPNGGNPQPGDRLFQLGKGTSIQRENAITVLRNGNTGIGVLDPAYILDINGRTRLRSTPGLSAGTWLNNNSNTASNAFVGMRSDLEVGFYGQTGTIGWRFYVNTTDGNAWLQGSLTQNSDARLKKNIIPLSNSLNSLMKLNGYYYNWTDPQSDSSQQIGVIAQEVQKLYPQLVKENDKGVLSVNYTGLIPVLLEGMKEQQLQIEELKKLVLQLAEKVK